MNYPQVPLGDIADFINGAAFKPEDWGDDGLPIIRIQNLADSSKPFNYTRREVSKKLVVNPGDCLSHGRQLWGFSNGMARRVS